MKRVRFLISESLGRDEVARRARAQMIMRRWTEVVGEEMAERSYPDRYSNGTVWVAVTGSAWAQELRMNKDTILKRLREMSDETGLFVEVRFGVRPIRRKDRDPLFVEQTPERPSSDLSIREIARRRLRNWPHGTRD